jgi:hypothetical protein
MYGNDDPRVSLRYLQTPFRRLTCYFCDPSGIGPLAQQVDHLAPVPGLRQLPQQTMSHPHALNKPEMPTPFYRLATAYYFNNIIFPPKLPTFSAHKSPESGKIPRNLNPSLKYCKV